MKPARSCLFVPADKDDWIASAPETGADVVILDLEDAVDASDMQRARETVANQLPELAAADQRVHVRISGPLSRTPAETSRDLEAIVGEGLEAVVVPQAETAAEMRDLAAVIAHIERRQEIDRDVELVASPETATGYSNLPALLDATPRIGGLACGISPHGDVARDLGFDWTTAGTETLHIRSRALLEARNAGVPAVVGPWIHVDDESGLRADAERNRELGFDGYLVIHPSHVPVVNEVFAPDPEAVAYYRDLLEEFEERDTTGAQRYQGEMVDHAMLKTARRIVEKADAIDQ